MGGGVSGGASQSNTGVDFEVLQSGMGFASPDTWLGDFQKFLPALQQMYEPARVQTQDAATQMGKNNQEAFKGQMTRAGMPLNSGMGMYGMQSINQQAQNNWLQALTDYYNQIYGTAANQADQSRGAYTALHTNSPMHSASSSWNASVSGGAA